MQSSYIEFLIKMKIPFALEQFYNSVVAIKDLKKFKNIYNPMINYEYITIDPYLLNITNEEVSNFEHRIDILHTLHHNLNYNPHIDKNLVITKCLTIFLDDVSNAHIFLRFTHSFGDLLIVLFKETLKYSTLLIRQPKKMYNVLSNIYMYETFENIPNNIKHDIETNIIDVYNKEKIAPDIEAILNTFNFTAMPITIAAVESRL